MPLVEMLKSLPDLGPGVIMPLSATVILAQPPSMKMYAVFLMSSV